MSNDVLTAIPLFLFMGYIVERANIVDRLFTHAATSPRAHVPGSLAVAALITCTLFATATGIVGAVVTLMGLLALAGDAEGALRRPLRVGRHLRRRHARHPDPALDHADRLRAPPRASRWCASMPARCCPGLLLAGLYIVYVVGRAMLQAAARAQADATRTSATHSMLQLAWMMLTSFLPLAVLILAVLGAILFGLATPSEAAAVGALGGLVLAVAYRALTWRAAAGIGLSDGPHHGDGLLAVRRLGDLRLGLRLSRRPAGDRATSCTGLDISPLTFLIIAQVDHLHARLAARMDRDHRHLHADLPAAAGAFRHRPAVLRHPGRAQPADGVPVAADGDVGLLPQGHRAAARAARRRSSAGCMPYLLIVILAMVIVYVFPQIVYWLPDARLRR